MATFYPDVRGGIAIDDADLQQAVQEDLQWEPRVDAAHAAPSAGFLRIVVGYDGSAPASRALDGQPPDVVAAARNSIREALAPFASGQSVPLAASIWIVRASAS